MLFPVSPALEKDLATARQLFGPNSVQHRQMIQIGVKISLTFSLSLSLSLRSYGSIDDSDVDMYIDIKDILDVSYYIF